MNCTSEGKGVSPQGRVAKKIFPKTHSARGYGVPLARAGSASGYRTKDDEDIDHTAVDELTNEEEKLLADWDEYTLEELIAMGGVDPEDYELGQGSD